MKKDINILIVEDSPAQAEQLKHLMKKQGYIVRIAANGRQALDMIQKYNPTLIVSDIMMPEMDGYTLCKEMHILVNQELRRGGSVQMANGTAVQKNLELDELRKLNEQLEKRVEEKIAALKEESSQHKRTDEALRKSEGELKKRVKELERFYDMAVGRELKMMELKGKIEELREKLRKYEKP